MNQSLRVLLLSGLLFIFANPAYSGIILQDLTGESLTVGDVDFFNPYAGQTFTAEDPLLGAIAFSFSLVNPQFAEPDITIELFDGVGIGGMSLGTVTQMIPIGSLVLANSDPPIFVDFDFSGVGLTVGNMYSAQVRGTTGRLSVLRNFTNPYAEGQFFRGGVGSDPSFEQLQDAAFRITPAPVPAPSAFLLFATGFAVLISRQWWNAKTV